VKFFLVDREKFVAHLWAVGAECRVAPLDRAQRRS